MHLVCIKNLFFIELNVYFGNSLHVYFKNTMQILSIMSKFKVIAIYIALVS